MQNHSNSGFLKATSSLHIPNHVFGGPNDEIAIASRPCSGPQLSPSHRYKHPPPPHHHLSVATIIIILIAVTYHLGF